MSDDAILNLIKAYADRAWLQAQKHAVGTMMYNYWIGRYEAARELEEETRAMLLRPEAHNER